MPVGTYNATDMVKLKRERLFKVSTRYGRYTRKNTVFDYFFHKSTKRITSESGTTGKMGPTCCPTIRSTGTNPQLVVPVRYKARTVLQFWIFSAFSASLKSKRQRAFLDFGERYAHQIFGTNVIFGGGYENTITVWLGFEIERSDANLKTVRICGKLIKFSAFFQFLSTGWEFLHAVFTTMRYFYCKNRK